MSLVMFNAPVYLGAQDITKPSFFLWTKVTGWLLTGTFAFSAKSLLETGFVLALHNHEEILSLRPSLKATFKRCFYKQTLGNPSNSSILLIIRT